MIDVALFTAIAVMAIYRPMIGVAIISHIYLIRSLTTLNSGEACFTGDCALTSSGVFGLALPILVFTILIIKVIVENRHRPIRYNFDYVDALLGFYVIVMLSGCIYSQNIKSSLEYLLKFIFLGVSFFFVTKLYICNRQDKLQSLRHLFLATCAIGLLLSLVALYYFIGAEVLGFGFRLTLPGVHPIVFSLLAGQSFLISAAILLSKGGLLGTKNKLFLTINIGLCIHFLIIQLATNTRGVTISMSVAFSLLFILSIKKITAKQILFVIPSIIIAIGYLISKFDRDTLLNRFDNVRGDESVSERGQAYVESLRIVSDNPILGVGTDNFQYLSRLEYPHNFFLENLVSFGSLGLIINFGFIFTFIYFLLRIIRQRNTNHLLIGIYIITVFFFVETMFSFTIWMHKGLYLHLAFLSAHQPKRVSQEVVWEPLMRHRA